MTAPQALLLSPIHLACHISGFHTERVSLSNNGAVLLHSFRAEAVSSCRLAANITIKATNVNFSWTTGSALEVPCFSKLRQEQTTYLSAHARQPPIWSCFPNDQTCQCISTSVKWTLSSLSGLQSIVTFFAFFTFNMLNLGGAESSRALQVGRGEVMAWGDPVLRWLSSASASSFRLQIPQSSWMSRIKSSVFAMWEARFATQ